MVYDYAVTGFLFARSGDRKGDPRNMCDVLDKVKKRGIAKGKIEGKMEGKAQVITLMKKLFEQNRVLTMRKRLPRMRHIVTVC